jgi:RNA polymerase sigma-70 factor (ECF subfamily)
MTEERADRLTSASPSPDAAYADQRFDDDVERALATLPPDFRAAVVLCDVEGLSYEEIAEILGAKLGTVRSRIHRGRALLRRALAHRAPGTGRARYSGPLAAPLRPVRGRAGSDTSASASARCSTARCRLSRRSGRGRTFTTATSAVTWSSAKAG